MALKMRKKYESFTTVRLKPASIIIQRGFGIFDFVGGNRPAVTMYVNASYPWPTRCNRVALGLKGT